jgi:hypothetical protein
MTMPERSRGTSNPELSRLFLKFAVGEGVMLVVATAVYYYTNNILWLLGILAPCAGVLLLVVIPKALRIARAEQTSMDGSGVVQSRSGRF